MDSYRDQENTGGKMTTKVGTAANKSKGSHRKTHWFGVEELDFFVQTEDLTFRSATDVHLNSSGHASLSPSWADAMFVAQNGVLLGDCNLDGVVNFSDINPFIGILASGAYLAQADCNQDGEVSFADIASFISILSFQ